VEDCSEIIEKYNKSLLCIPNLEEDVKIENQVIFFFIAGFFNSTGWYVCEAAICYRGYVVTMHVSLLLFTYSVHHALYV